MIDPRWRSTTVIDLCRSIQAGKPCTECEGGGCYECDGVGISLDYRLMPILGDALMDAGCDNEAMLTVCAYFRIEDESDEDPYYRALPKSRAQRVVASLISSDGERAVEWLIDFAEEVKLSYQGLMESAVEFLRHGNYKHLNFDTPDRVYVDKNTFWKNFEIVTGRNIEDHERTFFTCAC